MDVTQRLHDGPPRHQPLQDFWGGRTTVLTVRLEDLPAGYQRVDRLTLDIRELREIGIPPVPLTLIHQSKGPGDLGVERRKLYKSLARLHDDAEGAEPEGGPTKKLKVKSAVRNAMRGTDADETGGEEDPDAGLGLVGGPPAEADPEKSETAMPAAQGEKAATAPQESSKVETTAEGSMITWRANIAEGMGTPRKAETAGEDGQQEENKTQQSNAPMDFSSLLGRGQQWWCNKKAAAAAAERLLDRVAPIIVGHKKMPLPSEAPSLVTQSPAASPTQDLFPAEEDDQTCGTQLPREFEEAFDVVASQGQ